jgi:hypothetical protein
MSCARIATYLDEMMLRGSGVDIAQSYEDDSDLPLKNGTDVARELGGRYLLRYLSKSQIGRYTKGSTDRHWVTPTPYSSQDCITWLNLPAPHKRREYVLLLNPMHIPSIAGPRWIAGGFGIEYVLPQGFPANALVFRWEWPVS